MKMISVLIATGFLNVVSAHEITVKVVLSPAGNFEAKSAKMKGEVKKEGNKITAENLWVKTEELKTGIDLRDEHFQKHLNFEKIPKITFTKVTAMDGKGSGTLTVNEIPKVVPFTYKMLSPTKIEATFNVKNSDFKLKDASYMGIGVKDDVEVVAILDV